MLLNAVCLTFDKVHKLRWILFYTINLNNIKIEIPLSSYVTGIASFFAKTLKFHIFY